MVCYLVIATYTAGPLWAKAAVLFSPEVVLPLSGVHLAGKRTEMTSQS